MNIRGISYITPGCSISAYNMHRTYVLANVPNTPRVQMQTEGIRDFFVFWLIGNLIRRYMVCLSTGVDTRIYSFTAARGHEGSSPRDLTFFFFLFFFPPTAVNFKFVCNLGLLQAFLTANILTATQWEESAVVFNNLPVSRGGSCVTEGAPTLAGLSNQSC